MDKRILLAALVLFGGIGIAVAGASPQSALTPTRAVDASPGEASVKGMVEDVDRQNGTFTLTDGSAQLPVRYEGVLPAQVTAEQGLVASGELVHEAGRAVLIAEEIQIGCPSKYEA